MANGFLSEMIRRELKFLLPRALIFDGIIYIISFPVYRLCADVPLGLLAGTAVMLLNFIILGLSSERAVEKPLATAKGYMFGSYMIRLLITGALFVAGLKLPQINLPAAAIPQLYPKLAYTLDAMIKRKEGEIMEFKVNVEGPRRMFSILSESDEVIFSISESVVTGWLVILIVLAVCLILTKDLKKIPETKRQCAAEYIVKTVNNMIEVNMDRSSMAYAPYIAAVFAYIIVGTLISMIGFRSITADISVTGGLALMTFVLITYTKLKYNGVGGYFKQFINPLNIIGEVATPVAMALRLFGNVSGGMIITLILYIALGSASGALYNLMGIPPIESINGYVFNIFQIGIPAVLSIYFDLFSGAIQSYVFIMLTMAYIKMGKE